MSGKTIRTLLGLTTFVLPALMSAPAMADVDFWRRHRLDADVYRLSAVFMTLPGLSLFYAGSGAGEKCHCRC